MKRIFLTATAIPLLSACSSMFYVKDGNLCELNNRNGNPYIKTEIEKASCKPITVIKAEYCTNSDVHYMTPIIGPAAYAYGNNYRTIDAIISIDGRITQFWFGGKDDDAEEKKKTSFDAAIDKSLNSLGLKRCATKK